MTYVYIVVPSETGKAKGTVFSISRNMDNNICFLGTFGKDGWVGGP